MADTLSPCAETARRQDRDRFLCAMFAPADRREALFTLLAFNAEIAAIPDRVSEPLVGEMRLQWWRDNLAAMFDAPGAYADAQGHFVLPALAEAVRTYSLPPAPFECLIDARSAELGEFQPRDEAAFVAHAEATSSPLNTLMATVLEDGYAPPDDGARAEGLEAAADVGAAWAMTGLVRAVPARARQGRVFLPRDLLDAAGIGNRAVLSGSSSAELRQVVARIAALAAARLAAARARRGVAAKRLLPVLGQGVLAQSYLARLKRADHDPFDASIEGGRFGRQLRLTVSALRGAY